MKNRGLIKTNLSRVGIFLSAIAILINSASAQGYTPLGGSSKFYCFQENGESELFKITSSGYSSTSFSKSSKSFKKSFRGNARILRDLKNSKRKASKKKKKKIQKAIKQRINRRKVLKEQLDNLDRCKKKIPLPEMAITGSVKVFPSKFSGDIVAAAFFTMPILKISLGKGLSLDTGDGSRWCVTIDDAELDRGNFAPPYGAEVRFFEDPCDNIISKTNYGFASSCRNSFDGDTVTWVGTATLGRKVGDESRAIEDITAGLAGVKYTARPAAGQRNCGRPLS